jgi:hypothetical protein
VQPAIRLTAVLAFAAAAAAYELGGPVNDLRLGGGIQMAPKVTERIVSHQAINPATGTAVTVGQATGHADFDWNDTKAYNFYFDASYVRGWSSGRRGAPGLAWGGGLHFARMNLAPGSYTSGGITYATTRQRTGLNFSEYGLAGQLSWATRPRETGFGEYHMEFGGFLRGGPLQGQTETTLYKTTAAGTYTETVRASDWGWWGAAGPQVGAYVVDKAWLVGITAEWAVGTGRVDFDDLPNGDASKITLTRNGLGGSLVVGGRF